MRSGLPSPLDGKQVIFVPCLIPVLHNLNLFITDCCCCRISGVAIPPQHVQNDAFEMFLLCMLCKIKRERTKEKKNVFKYRATCDIFSGVLQSYLTHCRVHSQFHIIVRGVPDRDFCRILNPDIRQLSSSSSTNFIATQVLQKLQGRYYLTGSGNCRICLYLPCWQLGCSAAVCCPRPRGLYRR